MMKQMRQASGLIVEADSDSCHAAIAGLSLDIHTAGFQMEMQMEIRFKKCGISNQPDVCIFDDPCLSKFGALRGSCPHPGRQFVGLLCVSLIAPLNKT